MESTALQLLLNSPTSSHSHSDLSHTFPSEFESVLPTTILPPSSAAARNAEDLEMIKREQMQPVKVKEEEMVEAQGERTTMLIDVDIKPILNPTPAAPSTSRGVASTSRVPQSLLNRMSGPSSGKAGLGIRDPQEVTKIIYEASRGSAYFKNEAKKDAALTKRVDELISNLDQLVLERGGDLSLEESEVDNMIRQLEATRDLTQTIVVVDADAFFASCHELRDPTLIDTAFAVGGMGIMTTASYEARKYGCRSAMPGYIGMKLCPHLKIISPDFAWYLECSRKIMDTLRSFGETSPASLDEAYVSVTDYCARENVTPAEAGERMRAQVKLVSGLTVSAGISPNALISKVAADLNKPNGQFVVEPTVEASIAFASALPIRKISGIGRVSERWLTEIGVQTVGDIYTLRGKLYLVRKQIGLTFLLRAYLGLGNTIITQSERRNRKSVGTERTFATIGSSTLAKMYAQLRHTAESLAEDLASTGYSGRTLHLVYKLDTYEPYTRSHTPGKNIYFSDADRLYKEAKKLLDVAINERAKQFDNKLRVIGCGGVRELRVRLLGIRVTQLRDTREERKGSLDSWMINTKPQTIEEESDGEDSNDEAEVTVDVQARIHNRSQEEMPEVDQFDLLAEEEYDEVGRGLTSSEQELWKQVDDGVEIAEVEEERYKPFYTAGPSMNSRTPLASKPLAAKKDRISFESSSKGPTNEWTCPMCEREFKGSETGFTRHANMCLDERTKAEVERVQAEKKAKRAKEKGKAVSESSPALSRKGKGKKTSSSVSSSSRHPAASFFSKR